ncbi:MAG: protein-methionine-sulfoxide reductase catalytic subunit MsrP [Rhodobiaceae bacterium]|nr:protein-methionine-sulfoxide reductase catalytic subunit MsrP [Rhodobiaceae bacterium]
MLIRMPRGWEIPESQATPEAVFLNRRAFMAGTAGLVAAGTLAGGIGGARAEDDPSAGLYPAGRNAAFDAGRPITDEKITSTFNNFYEFGSSKHIAKAAQDLPIRPWTVKIDGMVEKEQTVDIDTLLKAMTLEERVYRHRCVEAWAMTVPWTGFPLKKLVDYARPLGSAKYVRFETFMDKSVAGGQKQGWYPWPYVEGLTMAEATNDLAMMVTGAYGKPLAKQFGSPLRLHTPWKYGFKSIKSIVRVSFTDERPVGFWEAIQASEYGFWANVNPDVPHPRWSQASEQLLSTGERIPTKIFNGYGEYVADIYKGLEGERLYA